MPRTTFELMILLEKSINIRGSLKGIASKYLYEDTGQGTDFNATTEVWGS